MGAHCIITSPGDCLHIVETEAERKGLAMVCGTEFLSSFYQTNHERSEKLSHIWNIWHVIIIQSRSCQLWISYCKYPLSPTYQRITLQQDCRKQTVVLQKPQPLEPGLWSKWLRSFHFLDEKSFLRKLVSNNTKWVILQIWH